MDTSMTQGGAQVAGYMPLEAWRVELLVPAGTPERHVEIMRWVLGEGLAVLGQYVTSRGVTISLEGAHPSEVTGPVAAS